MAYVHDVAAALECVATRKESAGRVYNAGWHQAITQLELVANLAEVAGVSAQVAYIPRAALFDAGASPFDAPYYFGESLDISGVLGEFHLSTERAKRELALHETGWHEALQKAFEWYQSERSSRPEMTTEFEDQMLQDAPTMALERPER